jgi:hypothetical protein
MVVVKHIVRYVAGTHNWGLWYGREKDKSAQLMGFSDSDYVGDIGGRALHVLFSFLTAVLLCGSQ